MNARVLAEPVKVRLQAHYAFVRLPFRKTMGYDEMFDSRSQRDLFHGLMLWSDIHGMGLVTGPSGAGKSITVRRFVRSLDEARFRVVYLSHARSTLTGFLRSSPSTPASASSTPSAASTSRTRGTTSFSSFGRQAPSVSSSPRGPSRSSSRPATAGCGKTARPNPRGAGEGNLPGLPDHAEMHVSPGGVILRASPNAEYMCDTAVCGDVEAR